MSYLQNAQCSHFILNFAFSVFKYKEWKKRTWIHFLLEMCLYLVAVKSGMESEHCCDKRKALMQILIHMLIQYEYSIGISSQLNVTLRGP